MRSSPQRRAYSTCQGIVEQIDGVIEFDGEVYLVEMKWWDKPLGPGEVTQHMVRVYHRGDARGMFIANSGYSPAALLTCKEGLQKAVFVLCELDEVVKLLEHRSDLKEMLKSKVRAAMPLKSAREASSRWTLARSPRSTARATARRTSS